MGVLSVDLGAFAGSSSSKEMIATALALIVSAGVTGLTLSLELLALAMLAPTWHDIVRVRRCTFMV